MKQIKLSSVHVGGNEIKYIERAINKGEVSNYGENLDRFEKQLEVFFLKKSKIALLNSGTSAIHIALIHLGVKSGDEVICQSFTFSASANPIVYQGAIPVFVDSENETWNMCPLHLEKALKDRVSKGKRPKAIILVHSYGMPAKMDELISISLKYNIPIIEDAAEALGSTYNEQKCGTFGDYGIISFNGNKIITTSGGGALICKTSKLRERTLFLSTQARDSAPYYQHSEIGYNYSMSNIAAGIGRAQMEVLDNYIALRRDANRFYQEFFKKISGIKVFKSPNSSFISNHWLSCVLIDKTKVGFNNEDLRLELLKYNIETKLLWKPMHMQPVFKDYPYYGSNICNNLFKTGLCLPSGSNLTQDEKKRIEEVITQFIFDKNK
ncbi:dTDP-4-amino-4,6-dideoxygalactose transaminase [Flaviramulus basaltis]|uniref:dTDP-4-amino-4,6-dideoxygalactose transaminase n=1 Tax=Flaviramulus basaltis TaxID=369401 RepID=A0A1K2ICF4_9FLAO|nr:DegT/DnrJ/EryC1/StrS family aminotransferase [Flaviramulus basaltis]SFZ90109.1 dTDP-4-amino-4,6-dideoxygalactose transaminase [Flaviramulus basaltis]